MRLAELRPYRTKILRRLATGRSIEDAVLDTPLTPERLYGLARWNEAWRTAFDAAMLAGRHPGIAHGTEQGYRHDRCRCPECRAAHGH